jgi:hypothetical protein
MRDPVTDAALVVAGAISALLIFGVAVIWLMWVLAA